MAAESLEPETTVQVRVDSAQLCGHDAIPKDVPDLEALQGRIMAEIQAKLSQKEESLWRRGQVEIKRLQLEQREVTATVSKMQERQAALVSENQKIRGALVEVTSKFEQVVKQMREVLRTMPQQPQTPAPLPQQQLQQRSSTRSRHHMRLSPSPSEASTAASGEAVREEPAAIRDEPTPGGSSTAGVSSEQHGAGWSSERNHGNALHTPLTMWHGNRGVTASASSGADGFGEAIPPPLGTSCDLEASDPKTFRTPPRGTIPSPAEDLLALGLPLPASWRSATVSSPAVLSLASALPSASAAPGTPSPSPGPLKRLHIAEWLPDRQASATTVETLMETPPLPTRQSDSSSSGYPGTSPVPDQQYDFVSVELVKEPGFTTLGIEVNQDDGSLRVECIDEHGLVGRFNAKQEADGQANRVLIGDRIVEVNGVRKDPSHMLHECKVGQRLAMLVARRLQVWDADAAAAPEANAAKSTVATEDPDQASSPIPTKLRPEAQVFVPSAQKEPQISAPPGLERFDAAAAVAGTSSLLATSPQLMQSDTSDVPAAAEPSFASGVVSAVTLAAEGPEVKRALFH